ncbi:unnamed protein product [Caenorhabditis sp. 36 PRJEB53466]|nr:unnamed protein product [Caenorhabditis sp. 36 PRJEB53466]
MPLVVDLSSTSAVRLVATDDQNIGCAYLSNQYIPIFKLDTGAIVRRFEVPTHIAGLHFNPNKKHTLYAVDSSFGLHVFDTRSDKKNKYRLNPDVENHTVVCSAVSSKNVVAVSSIEFGAGISDVRGSHRRERYAQCISLFDIRNATEPMTTYKKHLTSEVVSMEFYKNGGDLLTGDRNGGLRVYDCDLRDEDNALRWTRYVKGPITKVGVINKRIVYSISDHSEATVFVDSKGQLEVLYGTVNEQADQPFTRTSRAFYKKPEWCIGLIKGVNDEIPLVAVHGVEKKKFLSLTAMNQTGNRWEKPLLSYEGHTGDVTCMTVTPEVLLTGGTDGKILIQISNFKNSKFGDDGIDHHRLTLNRGRLASDHDRGRTDTSSSDAAAPANSNSSADDDDDAEEDDSESEESSEDSDDSDYAGGPSSSKKKKVKKAKKESKKESKKDLKKESKKASSSSKKESKEAKEGSKKASSSSKKESKEESKKASSSGAGSSSSSKKESKDESKKASSSNGGSSSSSKKESKEDSKKASSSGAGSSSSSKKESKDESKKASSSNGGSSSSSKKEPKEDSKKASSSGAGSSSSSKKESKDESKKQSSSGKPSSSGGSASLSSSSKKEPKKESSSVSKEESSSSGTEKKLQKHQHKSSSRSEGESSSQSTSKKPSSDRKHEESTAAEAAEREKRRAEKALETPEQRAARKERQRKERLEEERLHAERKQKKREERKKKNEDREKKRDGEGTSTSYESEAKKSKLE